MDMERVHREKFCDNNARVLRAINILRTKYDGHALGISRGYVSGGALHITDGFLRRFEHKIIRFNRRGKRAVADVTIYGRHYEVTLGCEIESQPAVPLISSGTAKNIP